VPIMFGMVLYASFGNRTSMFVWIFSVNRVKKTLLLTKCLGRGAVCFSCHVKSVRLGFTYGKQDFHGPTVRERQRKQVEDAAIHGINAEPVTNWM
jgi:hypothetical protein